VRRNWKLREALTANRGVLAYRLGFVPSLRDSPINLSLPGTNVPGYRLLRPYGTISCCVYQRLCLPQESGFWTWVFRLGPIARRKPRSQKRDLGHPLKVWRSHLQEQNG
jgi:hypothetical protein